jgi:hypothetical protein
MRHPRFVGSDWVRIAGILLLLLAAAALGIYTQAGSSARASWLLRAGIVLAVGALLAGIHSHGGVYHRWMRAAETLGHVITLVVFGALYVFIVPVFAAVLKILDPLRLRSRPGQSTFWITKSKEPVDWESLQRMG